jgi:hypothetical protein
MGVLYHKNYKRHKRSGVIVNNNNNNNNNNRCSKHSSVAESVGLVENITTPAHCRNLMFAGPDPRVL